MLDELANDQQLNAYQLGLGLSDMCWLVTPAVGPDTFTGMFKRNQVAAMQTWLNGAGTAIPPSTASIVGESLTKSATGLTSTRPSSGPRRPPGRPRRRCWSVPCGCRDRSGTQCSPPIPTSACSPRWARGCMPRRRSPGASARGYLDHPAPVLAGAVRRRRRARRSALPGDLEPQRRVAGVGQPGDRGRDTRRRRRGDWLGCFEGLQRSRLEVWTRPSSTRRRGM